MRCRTSFGKLGLIVLPFLCLVCQCCKEYKLDTVKNDSYIVNIYKINCHATVPFVVEIGVIKLLEDFKHERRVVKCISADSASVKFISNDSIYIEFFDCQCKVDSTITLDLRKRNKFIRFFSMYDRPSRTKHK